MRMHPRFPAYRFFEWPQLLTLSRPVLASASLDFLFRCHEDVPAVLYLDA